MFLSVACDVGWSSLCCQGLLWSCCWAQVQPYGTPSSTRGLHRLHSVRGPGSPPLAPSPSLPTSTLHTGSRWTSLPADGHRPSPLPHVRLPQPPPGPPPSTSTPSSLPLPPPIGLLRNGSYIPVQASGVTQPPHVPNQAAVSGSSDPPLPSEPAGRLSPDPPLPLSPPPKHPLPPPPERPSAYGKPPQKDFGFPPHLPGLSCLPVAFMLLRFIDTYQSVQCGCNLLAFDT